MKKHLILLALAAWALPLSLLAFSTPNATQTSAAKTQTAVAGNATNTSIAGTQTAIAQSFTATPNATQTAVAGTQTAVAAATQTAVTKATQTAIASQSVTLTPTQTPSPTLTPTNTVWRIIANSGSNYTDTLGNIWYPDSHYVGGTGVTSGNAIGGTTDDTIYQGERWGNSTYTFPVVAGFYQVTLKFAETCSCDNGTGKRVFNISINGTTVKSNFDIYAAAGGSNLATDLVFTNITPVSGNITITFGPASSDNAKIGGIEIIPQTGTPTPTLSPTLVPAAGNGLCADYRNESWPFPMTSGVIVNRNDSQINFNWGTSNPGIPASVNLDNFDVHWTGNIEAPYSGVYTFQTWTDDGVSLTVNTTPVIGDWTNQSATFVTGYITLTAGTQYPIDMKYFDSGGTAVAALNWSCPPPCPAAMQTLQPVPQGRLYSSCAAAPIPTPTFTYTTVIPAPPVSQGLSNTAQLLGLEYIPFPVTSTSTNAFYDLGYISSTAANGHAFGASNSVIPVNTARWRIELVGLSATSGAANNDTIAVETRIGPYGLTCTTGYWNPANYSSATTLALPSRPQNLSTTYVWLNPLSVPPTEQIDVMGDPRFVPYADMLSFASEPFADNYNWFFKNLADTTKADYDPTYKPFLTKATNDGYNANNMDVPKQHRLWREGVLKTRSIYSAINGFSDYYAGAGGEMGGDSSNHLNSGVLADNGPWNGSGSGGHDEILDDSSSMGPVLIRNTNSWISMPFIGELWPDSSYAGDWSSTGSMATWGNLRNAKQTGGLAYRSLWAQCSVTGVQTYFTVQHRVGSNGSSSFMNGNSTAGNSNAFCHDSPSITPNWLYDSQVMSVDYNFAVPNTFSASRPWGLDYTTSLPPEWSSPPYSNDRTLLNVYSASTQTTSTVGFFEWPGNTNATQRTSAAIRSYWNSNVGWFVVNGFAPSTDAGFNFVARFALISCLRTFHDAGAPATTSDGVYMGGTSPTTNKNRVTDPVTNVTASYRIEPVPWVEITSPSLGQSLAGYQSVLLQWKKRYVRWDGMRYTENYPCIDDTTGPCLPADPTSPGNPDREWHSLTGTALAFNVIYSGDGGSTWKSCLTNNPASAGLYMTGPDSISGTASNFYQYSWNVAPLPAGNKLVRVECFRPSLPLHYGYHQLLLTTAP